MVIWSHKNFTFIVLSVHHNMSLQCMVKIGGKHDAIRGKKNLNRCLINDMKSIRHNIANAFTEVGFGGVKRGKKRDIMGHYLIVFMRALRHKTSLFVKL